MQDTPADTARRKHDIVVFCALFATYFLLILYPILRADRYWNDDLIRALLGNYGWNHNGRPLANLLMRMLELGSQRAVDLSPLPQLAAIGLLAWAGVLIARRFMITSPALAVLAALPLGAQPFFLENLAYKFDAGFMALALLLALWPVVRPGRPRSGWWFGLLALIASLSLYQPAFNAFLIFVALEAFASHSARTPPLQLLRTLAARALQAMLALLLYRWAFEPTLQDWVLEHSQTISLLHDWPLLARNIASFHDLIIGAFNPRVLILFAPLIMLLVLVPIISSVRRTLSDDTRHALWLKLLMLAASVLLPIAAVLAIAGPMLLLTQPIVMPRVLIGVGALLSAGLIALHIAAPTRPASTRWQLGIGLAWALAFAVHAAAFGNAAGAQQRYESAIATQLADDLAQLRSSNPLRAYVIVGSAGLAPVTAHVDRQFPLIGKLVLPYLQEDDFNTRNFLQQHLLRADGSALEALPAASSAPMRARSCGSPALFVRARYSLHRIDDIAVVRFDNVPVATCTATPDSAPVADVDALQQIQQLPGETALLGLKQ